MMSRRFPNFTLSKGGTLFQRWFGMRRPRPSIGRRTFVDPSAQFIGANLIQIGNRSIISEQCWFNVNDRSGSEPAIIIEDHCIISRRTFMSSGKLIRIGAYSLIGNESNFLGADHDFKDPFIPYMIAPALSGESIVVGVNCWMGSACTVMKGVSIGHGCVIGAGSLLTKSIPPLSVAVGRPARVIKRFRAEQMKWVSVDEWTIQDEASIPAEGDYLARLREKYQWIPMPYVIGGSWFGNIHSHPIGI